ncbi:hypothetical protein IE53DRAFT_376756 [Violaceomyces palustris]|uniref:Uncharacterized protein n=1 Tax=Violaceomyces palustris TaxID=1673888 RepID=A0ACD0P839_9BASI|nr:hypothetical protein IE53DRAFT_376756 [Violaceomyces palustris]
MPKDPSSSTSPIVRTRNSELRSRKGCLTCKKRRKKCDEDFKLRQDGSISCNRCMDRGIPCQLPSNSNTSSDANSNQVKNPSSSSSSSSSSSTTLAASASSNLTRTTNGAASTHPLNQQVNWPSNQPIQPPPSNSFQQPPPPPTPTPSWQQRQTSFADQSQFYPQNLQNVSQEQQQQQQQQQHVQYPMQPAINQGSQFGIDMTSHRSGFRYSDPTSSPWSSLLGVAASQASHMNRTMINPSHHPPPPPPPSTAAQIFDGSSWLGTFGMLPNPTTPAAAAAAAAALNFSSSSSSSSSSAVNASQTAFGPELDALMLDDFVKDLMSLTGSGTETPSFTTPPHQSPNTPFPVNTFSGGEGVAPPSVQTSTSLRSSTGTLAPEGSRTNGKGSSGAELHRDPRSTRSSKPSKYRNLLNSSALETLLNKYSPIYERFWQATLMLSGSEKRKEVIENLMTLVRSTTACRASTVAVCLAYHELVRGLRDKDDRAQLDLVVGKSDENSSEKDQDDEKRSSAGPRQQKPIYASASAIMDLLPDHLEEERGRGDSDEDEDQEGSGCSGEETEEEGEEGKEEEEEKEGEAKGKEGEAMDQSSPSIGPSSLEGETSGNLASNLEVENEGGGPGGSMERRGGDDATNGKTRGKEERRRPARAKAASIASTAATAAASRPRTTSGSVGSAEFWTRIADSELKSCSSDLSVEQHLLSLINIRWSLLCFGGGARAFDYFDEFGRVIVKSGVTLDELIEGEKKGNPASLVLQSAVLTDVLDSAACRGRRAKVRFEESQGRGDGEGEVGDSSSSYPLPSERCAIGSISIALSGRISLTSFELLGCLKSIGDLAADAEEARSLGWRGGDGLVSKEEVETRSFKIMETIMALPAWSDPSASSVSRVRAFAFQEIWRQATIIHLHQMVHRKGPLHIRIQQSLKEIIRLSKLIETMNPSTTAEAAAAPACSPRTSSEKEKKRIQQGQQQEGSLKKVEGGGGSGSLVGASKEAVANIFEKESEPWNLTDIQPWELTMVWFISCTAAIKAEDRQYCYANLFHLGLEQASLDNLEVIRLLWKHVDETGNTVDWHDFVKEMGKFVTFAF